MNDVNDTQFPTSTGLSGTSASGMTGSSASLNGGGTVQRVAQKAHEAVDKLEQTLGASGEKVMGWQQEYGEMAREQVKSNPLVAVGAAFAVGIVFSKLFMR